MIQSLKIKYKLFISLVAIAVLTALSMTLVNSYTMSSVISQAEKRELVAFEQQLRAMIDGEAARAVSMASQVALQPSVQKHMAEDNREALSAIYVPGFAEMKKEHNVRQFQFHTPPAFSYLRVHRPEKYGDDLSSFRKSVLRVNETRQKVSGLEVGVAGLGMRGIAPIFYNGNHVGSIEYGLSFGQPFFDNYKKLTGADVALFMDKDKGLEVFASTFPANALDPDNTPIASGLRGASFLDPIGYNQKEYALMSAPVKDFSGNIIGVLVLSVDRSYFVEEYARTRLNNILLLTFTLIVAFGLAYIINRILSTPINNLTRVMSTLATGDLTVDIPHKNRKDEIGDMASAVEVFKQAGLDKIRLEKEAEEERKASEERRKQRLIEEEERKRLAEEEKRAQEIKVAEQRRQDQIRIADDFEDRVGAIVSILNSASTDMASAAQILKRSTNNVSDKSASALTEARVAGDSVQSVASASEELFASVQEVSSQLTLSNKVTQEAVEQSGKAAQNVEKLKETGERISSVISLINDIADQTNLLALNATIEAARAGEAGKGFAVVASEVKALATQTSNATDEIAGQIQAMQSATLQTVDVVKLIGATIEKVDEISTAIAGAAEEQTAATQEISTSAQRTATGTDHVVSNIDSVSGMCEQNVQSAQEVLIASSKLAEHSEELKSEVQKFLLEIRG